MADRVVKPSAASETHATRDAGPVVVVCAADAAYVQPLAVMLQSVFANLGAGRTIVAYILDGGVPEGDKEALARSWGRWSDSVRWLPARTGSFEGAPLWGRMSAATYLKLGIADHVPETVRRAIWLDCDMVVTGDVGRLWDHDLGGRHALAVQDCVVPYVSSRGGVAAYAELGLPPCSKYFNAGVMLLDLALWRRDDVASTALEYLRARPDRVYFWDQEGLNAALAAKWGELDPCWNYNTSVPERWRRRIGLAADATPRILHYAGSLKPWRYPSGDRHRRLYFEYLDTTVWRGWRPPARLGGFLIGLYETSHLRELVYPLEQFNLLLTRRRSRRLVAREPHVENA